MVATLTQALSIALSGLQASTTLITLTSKNISNASTPGYTEKSAGLTNVDFGDQFGGVKVDSYTRAANTALTQDYNAALGAGSYASTQNTYITQMQSILGSTSTTPTLQSDMANFSSAWNTYTSDPESTSAQQTLLNSGQQLASDIQYASGQVALLKSNIQSDIGASLTTVNSTLQSIATLNNQIQMATASDQQTVDLQDEMNTEVQTLSGYMNVSVQSRADGEVAIYTPGGLSLVDGLSAKSFTYNGTSILDNTGSDVTSSLKGGSIQAALDFISTSPSDLASTTPGIGTIGQFNAQLSLVVDSLTNSSGNTSSAFASAYASAFAASTATGATQSGDDVASSFFTVSNNNSGTPDPATFEINSNLINSSEELPQTDIQNVANSFNTLANYSTSGLTANSVTYSGLVSAMLSKYQQAASSISTENASATSQQTYYQTSLSNATGVNTDTELANLITYQNSYAACAHVMTTINQMLSTLMDIVQ